MCDKLKWLSIIDNNLKTIDGKRLNQPLEVAEVLLYTLRVSSSSIACATFLLIFGHMIRYL